MWVNSMVARQLSLFAPGDGAAAVAEIDDPGQEQNAADNFQHHP